MGAKMETHLSIQILVVVAANGVVVAGVVVVGVSDPKTGSESRFV
ncbi:DUF3927 domain-containing protein [Hymenobacter lapidiphilus]|nr:DUF3927 domain-containing protein [Hymenobacter sp. CCM 8763]